jgi:transcriptional regulator with XRE-family HTH domain
MNQTARQARAMSRRVPPDRVLYIELTEFIMNTDPAVRQSERLTDLPNDGSPGAPGAPGASGASGASAGPPLELIAASLRRERRRTGLSLTEVARRAGIAKSTLSQLESGTGNPSLETLWAICVALDAPFSRLLDPPRPRIQVIRADQGLTVSAAHANYQATLLAACPPGARRDVYRIAAEPGHPRESQAHMAGVVEHVVLSSGRALVGVAGEPVELGPGDYICYPADLPHVFEALSPETLAVLVSEHT